MSFRIEDILRKDSTCANSGKQIHNGKIQRSKSEELENSPDNFSNYSILQHTLLSKINPYYSHVSDCYGSEKLYSSVYNYDRTYLSHIYPDLFAGNGTSYFSLHARNRLFSPYESLPMMFHMSSKRKGGQVRFTSNQTDALEKRFHSHKYLSPEDRKILADTLKLTDKQVKTWFQNRRAKWRRSNSTSSNNTDTEYDKQGDSDSERQFYDHR